MEKVYFKISTAKLIFEKRKKRDKAGTSDFLV